MVNPLFNEATYTALVAENVPDEATRQGIFGLLEFSQNHALKVVGGKENRTFHYAVSTSGGSATLFYCDSYGRVDIALGNFPQLCSSAVTCFARTLGALSPAFGYVERLEDRRKKGGTQGFLVKETLVNHRIMEAFQAAIRKLQDEIQL